MIKIKRIVAFVIGIFKLFLTFGKSKAKIYDEEESIKNVLDQNRSIIRLGDGEYRMIVRKKDIHYQKFDHNLKAEMLDIIENYNNNSKYLLCVPQSVIAENGKWFFNHNITYFIHFIDFRFYFRYFMNNKVEYGDAMMFTKENEEKYKQLWEDKKNIIFVHNDSKWAQAFQKKYKKNVEFVCVPSENSYDNIDEIEKEIMSKIEKVKFQEYAVLISAGPTAKCLVYRLAKKNILSYDCGHCWDEPLVFKK